MTLIGLVIKTALVAVVLAAGTFNVRAQSTSGDTDPLTFEVASVKPSTAGCPPECGLIRSTGGEPGIPRGGRVSEGDHDGGLQRHRPPGFGRPLLR
jgi:hypothetical protein